MKSVFMNSTDQNIKFKNLLLLTVAAVSLSLSSFSAQAMIEENIPTANVRKVAGSLPARIAEDGLSHAIQEVSEGRKDFCFVPVIYRNNEKEFLDQLRVELPKDVTFAKNVIMRGSFSFSAEEKESQSSKFQATNKALIKFFHENTNASKLGEIFDLKGPELLARIILDHTEQIAHSKTTNQLSIIVRAMRENDFLLTYPRWHYDGGINGTRKEDLAFVGVLVGAPTVFANIKDDKRYLIQEKLRTIRNIYTPMDSILAETQLAKLEVHRDKYQEKYPENQAQYNNFTKAIANFNTLYPTNELLRRHYNRAAFYDFVENNSLIESTAHAQPFQLSVFNMYGKNPALHSEPHVESSRLFFSIQSEETPFSGSVDYSFQLSDTFVDPALLF